MAYLGNTPTQQAFTAAIDYFSGNGSTVAFTLSRPVASVAQVQVNVNNVAQNPSTAFTVSGNTITFTGAPSSGTNNIYVQYTSPITQVIQPGQGTVGTAQIQNGAVIPADLSTGAPIWDATGKVGVGALPVSEKFRVQAATDKNFVVDTSGSSVRISGVNDADSLNIPLAIQSSTQTALINGTVQSTVNSYGVGIGQAVPSSGTGITFPATQSASTDANTLDDYEEGTWTPTPKFNGANVGMTFSSAGKYTKVGNLVTVEGFCSISNKGSSTGSFSVYGLPFTPSFSGGLGPYFAGSIYVQGGMITGLSGNWIQPNTNGNSVSIDINYANQNTGLDGSCQNGNVATAGNIWFTCSYMTT